MKADKIATEIAKQITSIKKGMLLAKEKGEKKKHEN